MTSTLIIHNDALIWPCLPFCRIDPSNMPRNPVTFIYHRYAKIETYFVSHYLFFFPSHVDPPSMALIAMYHVRVAPPSIQLMSKPGCVKKLYAA